MDAAAVSTPSGPATGPLHAAPMTLIYDGRCGFCRAQSRRLARLARPGAITLADAHAPGVLESTRGRVNMIRAMGAVQLVDRRADVVRVYEGAEAVARALATRPLPGLLAHIYYLPLVRPLCDAAYRWIARNRYRISRWYPGASDAACESGACSIHRPGREGP